MAHIFNTAKVLLASGGLDWENDTIKVLLVHTSDPAATCEFVDEITNEPTGTGNYARKTLTTVAPTDVSGTCKLDASDLTGEDAWVNLTASTNPVVGLCVFKDVGADDGANPLIAFIDFADVTTNGGDLAITWHSDGVLKIT